MISRNKLLFVAAMGLAMSGCTTMGNRKLDNVDNYLSLREQQSTKTDVYANFGQPHDVRSMNADGVVWVYYKIHTRPSAWTYVPFVGMVAGGDARESTFSYFAFDSAGVLQKVHSTKGTDYQNMWAGLGRAIYRASDKTQGQRVHEEMDRLGQPFDEKIAKSVSALRDEPGA